MYHRPCGLQLPSDKVVCEIRLCVQEESCINYCDIWFGGLNRRIQSVPACESTWICQFCSCYHLHGLKTMEQLLGGFEDSSQC